MRSSAKLLSAQMAWFRSSLSIFHDHCAIRRPEPADSEPDERHLGTHRCWRLFIVLIIFTAGLVTSARADSTAARIGEVWVQDEAGAAPYHDAFADGLRELGYVEGQNLIVVTRYANGDESRLPLLLDELIRLKVDLLFVSAAAVGAAKKATATIPIVCATMNDPVGAGLVASLSRPAGTLQVLLGNPLIRPQNGSNLLLSSD
jgi:hypothetical protein